MNHHFIQCNAKRSPLVGKAPDIICGEFAGFGTACYHSAVNYTSLGYGDLIMSPSWKLLGPLKTADGMLLFGVSTAIIFAVLQRLVEAKFVDLKD